MWWYLIASLLNVWALHIMEILQHLLEMQSPRPRSTPTESESIYVLDPREFICKLKSEKHLLYSTNLTKFIFSLNEVVLS